MTECRYKCQDGIVWRDELRGQRIYRCRCELGRRHPEAFYLGRDKKREHPIPFHLVPLDEPCGRERAAGEGKDD